MEYRIRVRKICNDTKGKETEFSLEITGMILDRLVEDALGSLRSFNAEMEKQDEGCEGKSTQKEYTLKDGKRVEE